MDDLVHRNKKTGVEGRDGSNHRRASPSDVALGHAFTLTMPESSRNLPKLPRKIMGVVVVVCAAFGLTVSDAKTKMIMCLNTKEMPESAVMFSVEVAGQVYNQMEKVPRGTSTTMSIHLSRSTGAYATHGAGSTPSNCTTDRAFPSSSKSGC